MAISKNTHDYFASNRPQSIDNLFKDNLFEADQDFSIITEEKPQGPIQRKDLIH